MATSDVARPDSAAPDLPVTAARPASADPSGPGTNGITAPGEPEPSAVGPVIATRVHRFTRHGIACTVLTFDRRRHLLSVVDNARGPGTGAGTAKEAAKTKGAVASINGGFFTPEGNPLGLVIENGSSFGALNASSLGAGIYFHDPGSRRAGLIRRESWTQRGPRKPESLLQSGPILVERGKPVSGLSSNRRRTRSFLLWDGRTGWALGRSGSATLGELASVLAGQPIPDFSTATALNLDGGTSSDLWIASSVKGGPVSTRQLWNKPVRNYLVLTRITP